MTTRPTPGHGTRCRACAKPILWPGLCYTCATGRPRRCVPEEERSSDNQPNPPADEADSIEALPGRAAFSGPHALPGQQKTVLLRANLPRALN